MKRKKIIKTKIVYPLSGDLSAVYFSNTSKNKDDIFQIMS